MVDMRRQLKDLIHGSFNALGYKISPKFSQSILDDEEFKEIFEKCQPYTMSEVENMYALHMATKHVVESGIVGDFVECGVWKGGSAMLIALTLLQMKETDRKIYLYDTFEGMSKPTSVDKTASGNLLALDRWEKGQKKDQRRIKGGS